MEARTVTYEEALNHLTALVEEKGPDFTYTAPPVPSESKPGVEVTACAYAEEEPDGTLVPSCGVGQVFYRIDPDTLPILHQYDKGINGRFVGAGATTIIEVLRSEKEITLEPAAEALLAEFQAHQDMSVEYGDALENAIAEGARTLLNQRSLANQ